MNARHPLQRHTSKLQSWSTLPRLQDPLREICPTVVYKECSIVTFTAIVTQTVNNNTNNFKFCSPSWLRLHAALCKTPNRKPSQIQVRPPGPSAGPGKQHGSAPLAGPRRSRGRGRRRWLSSSLGARALERFRKSRLERCRRGS